MHVRMEIPVAQRMAQEQLQHPRAQHSPVMARSVNQAVFGQADAFGPAQGHHIARRQEPVRLRHLKTVVFLGIGRKLGRSRGFQPQIKLAHDHTFEMGDHIHGAQAARERCHELDHPGGKVEGVDILAEGAFDSRAQHLDRHLFACIRQPRSMHLRDRRGRDGFRKLGKDHRDGHLQLVLDHLLGDFGREGRQLVLQVLQLQGHLFTHDVGPGRQHLPEFDVGRPQRRQRTGSGRQLRVALQAQPLERPTEHPGCKAHLLRRTKRLKHHIHRAGSLQRGTRADQPNDVVRTPHSFQPECRAATPMVRLRYLTCPKPA